MNPQTPLRYFIPCDRRQWLLTHGDGDLDAPDVPPVVLRSHCKACQWHNACQQIAVAELDVSLLSSLRQDTRQHLRQLGITSLHQIAAMQPDDLRKIRGIKSTAAAVHAHARAWVSGHPVWIAGLAEVCAGGGWMFDIETNPQTNEVWCIGWCDLHGRDGIAVVAPQVRRPTPYALPDGREIVLVPDSDGAWEAFAAGVSGDQDERPIFHWTGFDAGVLHSTGPEAVREALGGRLHDLHHLVNQAIRFPVKSTSIKAISGWLGFAYSAYDAWDAALNDYNLWLSRGDDRALSRACMYQRDDVLAMHILWRWLVDHSGLG